MKPDEDNGLYDSLMILVIVAAITLGCFVVFDKDGILNSEDANLWTRVLCTDGTIDKGVIYDTCFNETGQYRAKFYGKKYYGNLTNSYSKYWHFKQVGTFYVQEKNINNTNKGGKN